MQGYLICEIGNKLMFQYFAHCSHSLALSVDGSLQSNASLAILICWKEISATVQQVHF